MLYTYFIAALLGRQMLPNILDRSGREDPDLFFPFFTVLQVRNKRGKKEQRRNPEYKMYLFNLHVPLYLP